MATKKQEKFTRYGKPDADGIQLISKPCNGLRCLHCKRTDKPLKQYMRSNAYVTRPDENEKVRAFCSMQCALASTYTKAAIRRIRERYAITDKELL